jgi:hypothetical protein
MPPLRLELQSSKRLVRMMLLIHSLALIASVFNNLPLLIKLTVFSTVLVHGYFVFMKPINAQQTIEHSETGWRVLGMEVEILPTTVISTLAIFLHFKTDDNAKHSLVIFNDVLSKHDYRNLLVRLKISTTNNSSVSNTS